MPSLKSAGAGLPNDDRVALHLHLRTIGLRQTLDACNGFTLFLRRTQLDLSVLLLPNERYAMREIL